MTFTVYNEIYFSTHSIYNWKHILLKHGIPKILLDAFHYLHDNDMIIIYAYVIMPNHVHWIYQVKDPFENSKIKHSFLSYTSKKILNQLGLLKESFLVNKSDRKYQLWKSPSLSVEIRSDKFLTQKMNYLHLNPVRAGLVENEINYLYSSEQYYRTKNSKPEFLTLW